jgi:hypothetical protein
LRRDAEVFVQPPDHADGQSAFSVQHLGNAGPSPDKLLQVPAREPSALMLHLIHVDLAVAR